MEFASPIFSGNGTYARTIVQGFCQNASFDHIDVITGVPDATISEGEDSSALSSVVAATSTLPELPNVVLHHCPVRMEKWFRLDYESDWKRYAEVSKQLYADSVLQGLLEGEEGAVVFGVDWHGMNAWRLWKKHFDSNSAANVMLRNLKVVYLNFRVFANPTVLLPNDAKKMDWYKKIECLSVQSANVTVALSEVDRQLLRQHISSFTEEEPAIQVVLPPVSDTVLTAVAKDLSQEESDALLPADLKGVTPETKFLVCCVRISPEKNPSLFVDCVAALAQHHAQLLESLHIVPLMFGSTPNVAEATALYERLTASCPTSRVLRCFVSPVEMISIFRRSVLNFHPCLYDAYGLTIVEAAAAQCLSVVHRKDTTVRSPSSACEVGASALMQESLCYVDLTDTAENIANKVATLLQEGSSELTQQQRLKAKEKAVSYNAAACSKAIVDCIV